MDPPEHPEDTALSRLFLGSKPSQDAAWFSLADLDRPDLIISDTTRTLLHELLNGP